MKRLLNTLLLSGCFTYLCPETSNTLSCHEWQFIRVDNCTCVMEVSFDGKNWFTPNEVVVPVSITNRVEKVLSPKQQTLQ